MSGDIPFSGSIYSAGTFPILGAGAVSLATTTNHVLTPSEYQNQDLVVGSLVLLTSTVTLTFPNTRGTTWYVVNNTAGTQTLLLGAGGAGTVPVLKGQGAFVRCDGSGNMALISPPSVGGGPILNAVLYATPAAAITRSGAWMVQPYSTFGGAGGFTAPAITQIGDRIEVPDAERTWGASSKGFTFNGNAFLVEDPFNQSAALAGTWVSPLGFSDDWVGWMLLATTNRGTFWKAM